MPDEVRESQVSSLLGHSVTGMLLVAFLDGVLAWEERTVLVQAVNAVGHHVTSEQALKFLDDAAHALSECQRDTWASLFVGARTLPPEHKVMLLALCTKVAFSDGHLDTDEGRLLQQIADWIGLDKAGHAEWRSTVQQAISDAQRRDSVFTGFENLF